MKKAVKKRTIKEKEVTKILINGKDTMPVLATDEFKRHVGCTLHRVFSTAERGRAAVNHLVDVFNFDRAKTKRIYDFFIMIGKDLLQNIHTIIMQ